MKNDSDESKSNLNELLFKFIKLFEIHINHETSIEIRNYKAIFGKWIFKFKLKNEIIQCTCI